MKKISIWLLSIVVLLCVTSCKENNEPEMKKNNYTEKAKDIQLEENEFTSIVLTTSEKIVYNKIDENGNLKFYVKDIQTNATRESGNIEGFLICNNRSLLVDKDLYFFVTVLENEQTRSNVFYRLNIEQCVLEELYREQNMQTFFYLAGNDETIYVAKGKLLDETMGYTYIESYNIKDGTRKEIIEYEIDYKNGEGRIITNICLYDEYIYSVEEIVADGISDYAITVYNEQGKFEKTIEMSDYKDDVFNTAISQIYVNGQYLFITNFMDTTLIGSIGDGEIKKIQLEKNLSIAQNSMPSYKKPVLYMRESSIFYAFDEEKGKLLKYDISEDFESYYISYMAQDNKGGVWMYLTDENNEEVRKFHYFAKEEF